MATRIIFRMELFAAVIFLTAASFAAEVRFEDNGVAPSYRPYYPCLTVKDRENRIVAVLSGDGCDLSRLPVDGMQAQEFVAKFMIGRWAAPLTLAGEYDVWLSVGEADGTPRVSLPIDAEHDSHRRYRCGNIAFRSNLVDGGDAK